MASGAAMADVTQHMGKVQPLRWQNAVLTWAERSPYVG